MPTAELALLAKMSVDGLPVHHLSIQRHGALCSDFNCALCDNLQMESKCQARPVANEDEDVDILTLEVLHFGSRSVVLIFCHAAK